ncbi:MAG TPA: hypothetical protein VNC15_03210 [Solirubrobacterales bacterium]|nr:hypothetical protein [Solirubrobacterales bacterium]
MKVRRLAIALTVLAAFLSAIPTAASSQEQEVDGVTSFSGLGGASSLTIPGEPAFTTEGTDVIGTFTSSTTGEISFDVTGCHTTLFGMTSTCRTAGSPLNNTVEFTGTFHMITANNKPAMLLTLNSYTMSGPFYSPLEIKGSLIGTVAAPACNVASTEMRVSFAGTGSIQNDKLYTGVNYFLTVNTEGHSAVEASWTIELILKSATSMKMTCQ